MKKFKEIKVCIESEIDEVLSSIDENQLEKFIQFLIKKPKVCGYGARKNGLWIKSIYDET